MATTVVGLFNTREAANNAVSDLVNQGFDKGDIQFSAAGSNNVSGSYDSNAGNAALTGTQESGWDKFLEAIHLRAPEHDRDYYSNGVGSGQIMVSVITADDDADDAAATLQNNGAIDIDEQMAGYRSGAGASYAGTAAPADDTLANRTGYATSTSGATANYTGGTAADGTVIPIVEEQLEVGKRQVQSGGVRIYQHVTETPISQDINLHEERVTIDRRPVDRAVGTGDTAFQEGTFEVTETAEVPVVAKTARVVEEVVVGKTATDRTETVSDTVRRTDVDVEQIPGDASVTKAGANTSDTTRY